MRPWQKALTNIRVLGPDIPPFRRDVKLVWDELERLEAERDEAGRAGAQRTVRAQKRADEAGARLDKALAALREIVSSPYPTKIARAAIAEIEGGTVSPLIKTHADDVAP